MQTIRMLLLTSAVLALSAIANATTITFTYSDSGNGIYGSGDLSGSLNLDGSYTINSGTFQITGSGGYNTPVTTLAGPGLLPSVRVVGGTDLIFDDMMWTTKNPTLDGNGLAFTWPSGQSYPWGINIWGNGPDNYTLFYVGPVNHYKEFDGGSLTVTGVTNVPDGGLTLAMLGMALCGIGMARSRLQSA